MNTKLEKKMVDGEASAAERASDRDRETFFVEENEHHDWNALACANILLVKERKPI